MLGPLTRFTGEFLRFRNYLLPAPDGFVWLYLFTGSSRATTEYRGITFVNPDWSRRRFCHCACFIGETPRSPVCACTRICEQSASFVDQTWIRSNVSITISTLFEQLSVVGGNNAMCTVSVRKITRTKTWHMFHKKISLRNNRNILWCNTIY